MDANIRWPDVAVTDWVRKKVSPRLCKFLRRNREQLHLRAPTSTRSGAAHAAVHRVFGRRNVSKLLNHLPEEKRIDAVITVCYEAQARLRDPVYGCVSHIVALQQQIASLQSELNYIQNHLAAMEPSSQQVPFPAGQPQMPMAAFSVSDLPPSANIQANVDLSFLLDDEQASQQLQQLQQQHYVRMAAASGGAGGSSTGVTGDLHAVARELLNRHDLEAGPAPPPPRTHQ
ncbi:hypothetical protein PR202_gb07729 [Eleusine coracana subsp. coracana]|uniref:LOB domain-containing protein n=1 Tax=Eleusine coracana subsp. coracana TaxID=191504 RepID=A0AAV5ED07_ELECO|nr:hypothetical protein PR202_gb07729 [Eleusine coracana subsp. coracana]